AEGGNRQGERRNDQPWHAFPSGPDHDHSLGVGPLLSRSGKGKLVPKRYFRQTGITIGVDDVISLGSQLSTCHKRRWIEPLIQLSAQVICHRLDSPARPTHDNGSPA